MQRSPPPWKLQSSRRLRRPHRRPCRRRRQRRRKHPLKSSPRPNRQPPRTQLQQPRRLPQPRRSSGGGAAASVALEPSRWQPSGPRSDRHRGDRRQSSTRSRGISALNDTHTHRRRRRIYRASARASLYYYSVCSIYLFSGLFLRDPFCYATRRRRRSAGRDVCSSSPTAAAAAAGRPPVDIRRSAVR